MTDNIVWNSVGGVFLILLIIWISCCLCLTCITPFIRRNNNLNTSKNINDTSKNINDTNDLEAPYTKKRKHSELDDEFDY